ncbi:uncharacterized protein LOC129616420 [Condylostylus longicornis]|uniref:uncharacterized protein LOC129616420 n=1 Tax=Condylostylus longicornis TaxID=2530218 RepID=UPI00244E59D5|nr:uncharacterized protein LOC129616420 [Condylostylus longicornis]
MIHGNIRKIYYYTPFEVANKLHFTNISMNKSNTSKLCEIFLKNYPKTFNAIPIRISSVKRIELLENEYPEHYLKNYNGRGADFGAGDFDGILYTTLSDILNVTYIIKSVYDFGYKLKNQSFIGTIGRVMYSEADITMNTHFIMDYNTNEIEYLTGLLTDKFCVIAPKADIIPQSMAVFTCFQPQTWAFIILMNFIFDIMTLDELDRTGLRIAFLSPSIGIIFSDHSDLSTSSYHRFQHKMILKRNATQFRQAIDEGRICYLDRKTLFEIHKHKYERPDGTFRLHLIPECPRSFSLTYIVRKGWSLTEKFNRMLGLINSSGLRSIWLKWIKEETILLL